MVAGVAAAVAPRIGVPALYVRTAFVLTSLAGGFGLVLYLVGWALLPDTDDEPEPQAPPEPRHIAGFVCIVAAVMFVGRDLGFWLGDPIVWPLTAAIVGSTVIASQTDTERAPWSVWTRRLGDDPLRSVLDSQIGPWRLAAGILLIAVGAGVLLVWNVPLSSLGGALVAVVIGVAGLGLVIAPLIARLNRQVNAERQELVRSEERAAMAAHLHDSVLQTLALIQRSDDPAEMNTLARAQERELRNWLFGRPTQPDGQRVEAALAELAARVEQQHNVPIDVVVVGDTEMDAAALAVTQACGEAMLNAARHAGAAKVSVYVEIEPDRITAYVTDEGRGFDPAAVGTGHGGIAESIIGRAERAGGTAGIDSRPGEGTETRIEIPRHNDTARSTR